MDDKGVGTNEFDKPETTQERVRVALHDELQGPITSIKRIQFWATLALVVAGAGFSAAMFLTRYATAASLDKAVEAQQETAKALNVHIASEASRMGSLESQGKNIESDYHWQREQLQKIADRVGAARVPAPEHEPAQPAERHR